MFWLCANWFLFVFVLSCTILHRSRLTGPQLDRLQAAFDQNGLPSLHERRKLAAELGVELRKVTRWFNVSITHRCEVPIKSLTNNFHFQHTQNCRTPGKKTRTNLKNFFSNLRPNNLQFKSKLSFLIISLFPRLPLLLVNNNLRHQFQSKPSFQINIWRLYFPLFMVNSNLRQQFQSEPAFQISRHHKLSTFPSIVPP